MKYPSTMLVRGMEEKEINKAIFDLLQKINENAGEIDFLKNELEKNKKPKPQKLSFGSAVPGADLSKMDGYIIGDYLSLHIEMTTPPRTLSNGDHIFSIYGDFSGVTSKMPIRLLGGLDTHPKRVGVVFDHYVAEEKKEIRVYTYILEVPIQGSIPSVVGYYGDGVFDTKQRSTDE